MTFCKSRGVIVRSRQAEGVHHVRIATSASYQRRRCDRDRIWAYCSADCSCCHFRLPACWRQPEFSLPQCREQTIERSRHHHPRTAQVALIAPAVISFTGSEHAIIGSRRPASAYDIRPGAMMALQSLVGTIGAAVGVTDSQMSGQTNEPGRRLAAISAARLPSALLAQRVGNSAPMQPLPSPTVPRSAISGFGSRSSGNAAVMQPLPKRTVPVSAISVSEGRSCGDVLVCKRIFFHRAYRRSRGTRAQNVPTLRRNWLKLNRFALGQPISVISKPYPFRHILRPLHQCLATYQMVQWLGAI